MGGCGSNSSGSANTADSGGGHVDGGGGEGGGGVDAAPLCPPPSGCPNPSPATTQLTTPAVSFKTDVIPIFQTSCSLSSSCHQLAAGGPGKLYLGGNAMDPADPSGILKATVNVKSIELPSMNYVTPGMPEESFLMHKMDGDQCQFLSMCSTAGSAPAQCAASSCRRRAARWSRPRPAA